MAFSKSHKQIVCVSNTAKQQNTFSTSPVIKVENRIFSSEWLRDEEKAYYDKNLRWKEFTHLEDPSKKTYHHNYSLKANISFYEQLGNVIILLLI